MRSLAKVDYASGQGPAPGGGARWLSEIDTAISSQHEWFTPIDTVGLASGTSQTLSHAVNPQGSFTDENLDVFKFRADRFGAFTEFGLSNGTDTTNIDRDANGNPVRVRQPDAGAPRRLLRDLL